MSKENSKFNDVFAAIASKASAGAGSVWAFGAAAGAVIVWAASGPLLGFSEAWQLAINTVTTIVTFLMVFVIQHAQNKDTRAVHLKLNELIAAIEGASNRLIDVEDLSDRELERLYLRFQRLAQTAAKISSGAKLTVDNDAYCGGSECEPDAVPASNSSGAGRATSVPIKPEAQGRKQEDASRF